MTTATAPMTKLDAVNQMLASIGQSPVSSLNVSGIKDVAVAVLALNTQLRLVLNDGWSFNTDDEYELVPDGSNNVLVPAGALWVDPLYRSDDFVMRSNGGTMMLYDRNDRTFTITKNPVKVSVIWGFDFEEIPQAARSYISTKAARVFQSQSVGSEVLYKYTADMESEALGVLNKMERRTKDRNMLRKDPAFHRRRNIYR